MSEQSPETKHLSKRMALTLVGLLIVLIILTLAASCSRPSVSIGQTPPSLPFTPAALTEEQRQAIAEDYIRTAGTYGWDTPVADWTRDLATFTQGTTPSFPLTGPSYARCLNDKCQYIVEQLRRVPDTDMDFIVTTRFITQDSREVFDSVWQVTVNTEGVITAASSAGEG